MQDVMVVLVTVGVTLAIIATCGLSVYFFKKRSEQNVRTVDALTKAADAAVNLREAVLEHVKGMNSYTESTKAAVDPLRAVPALVEGMVKIAAAEAKEIAALRTEVRNLKNLIFKKEDVRGFEQPSDADKSLVWDMNTILQQNPGMQRDQALQRALEMGSEPSAEDFNL